MADRGSYACIYGGKINGDIIIIIITNKVNIEQSAFGRWTLDWQIFAICADNNHLFSLILGVNLPLKSSQDLLSAHSFPANFYNSTHHSFEQSPRKFMLLILAFLVVIIEHIHLVHCQSHLHVFIFAYSASCLRQSVRQVHNAEH